MGRARAIGVAIVGFDDIETDAGGVLGTGVLLYFGTNSVVVRNNTFTGAHVGVYVNGSQNALVTDNVLTGNNLGFGLVAGSARVERNVATNNTYGVESDVAGADYGGGALGSAGGNTISCNGKDVWVSVSDVAMANNFWDHVPPVASAATGPADIFLFLGSTAPITTGAKLATPACP
jgi:parallel beta-helix repeat protein